MDPLVYLKALRRRWWLAVGVMLLALAAAFVTLPPDEVGVTPTAASYTATHVLLQSPEVTSPVNLALTALYATSGQVPQLAATKLGIPPEQGAFLALSAISVTVDETVGAMRVTASDPDPARAVEVADAFATSVQEFLRTRAQEARDDEVAALQTTLNTLDRDVRKLGNELAQAGVGAPLVEARRNALVLRYQAAFERQQALQEAGAAASSLGTLQSAIALPVAATGSPVPESRRGRLALAGLLGLLLGAALALVLDRLDTRLRTRAAVEEASGLPVVTEVPRLDRAFRARQEIVTAVEPDGAAAEAYRALRSALLLVPARPLVPAGVEVPPLDLTTWRPPQVVLITSASPSDGKTSTAVNLASTLAESGRSVIVLDADFRKPAANAYLNVPHGAGLSELLAGGLVGGLPAALRTTSVPGVRMVTSGSSTRHPAALLARIGTLIQEASALADVVIVDSAPLLVANDATDIVPHVDAVLLVAHAGKTTRPQIERSMELLSRLAVPVLGIVLQNSREVSDSAQVGYYGEGRRKEAQHASSATADVDATGPTSVSETTDDGAPDDGVHAKAEPADVTSGASPLGQRESSRPYALSADLHAPLLEGRLDARHAPDPYHPQENP